MITGKGVLILRDKRQIDVEYQFFVYRDTARTGYLLFDTSIVAPSAFCDRLTVECDDGTHVVVAVMQLSDGHLAVMGRAISPR